MEAHAGEWISAYYDGELHGARLAWIEDHLAQCEACRAELEQLKQLSALLMSVPSLADQPVPDRSSAPALRSLPPAFRTGWQKTLQTGWQAIPLGLILAWSFFQAVLLVSASAVFGGFGGLIPTQPLSGSTFWNLLSGLAGLAWIDPFSGLIPRVGLGESFFHLIFMNLALTLLTGVFLWGWLASWWIYRTRSAQWITLEF